MFYNSTQKLYLCLRSEGKGEIFQWLFCFPGYTGPPHFAGQFSPNSSLSNIVANPDEVLTLLLGVDISKACGHDGIGNRMIKLFAYGIYYSFTRLINISLSLDQYPKQWKFANVLPIIKKDEHNIKSNYRPVSLLPSLSKICEKIVFVPLFKTTWSKLDFYIIYSPAFVLAIQLFCNYNIL